MIRGEYEVNGVIVPNQLTVFGAQAIWKAAFWGISNTWYLGLCTRLPSDHLLLDTMGEPGATNGYARQAIPLNPASWPVIGLVNNETYAETESLTFPATGAYDTDVSRLFVTDGDYVISVSSQIPGGLQIIDSPFTVKYRIFLR